MPQITDNLPADAMRIVERRMAARLRTIERHQQLRASLEAFTAHVGRGRGNNHVQHNSFSRLFCRVFEHCVYRSRNHLSLVSMQGAGKSTLMRYGAAYGWGNDPTMRVVSISAARATSEKQVMFCRELVMSYPYRQLYPNVEPDRDRSSDRDKKAWRQNMFFLRTDEQQVDPAMEAVAAVPKEEARRTDLLLADDVMTRAVAESQADRQRYIRAAMDTWLDGRLKLGGVAVFAQNLWHKADLAHVLMRDDRVCSAWFGVMPGNEQLFLRIKNAPEGLFEFIDHEALGCTSVAPAPGWDWEVCFANDCQQKGMTKADLDSLERNNPENYRRNNRLIAMDDTDRMFPAFVQAIRERPCGQTACQLARVEDRGGLPWLNDLDRMRLLIAGGLDISSSKRKGCAAEILAYDTNRHVMFPLAMAQFNELLAAFRWFNDMWGRGLEFSALLVEDNATQDQSISLSRELGKSDWAWWGRIKPFTTRPGMKGNPELGLPAMNVLFETGQMVWPDAEAHRGLPHSVFWTSAETAMIECPRFLRPNETPDTVMARWFAFNWLMEHTPRGGASELDWVGGSGEAISSVEAF